jgi:hypothetical protein
MERMIIKNIAGGTTTVYPAGFAFFGLLRMDTGNGERSPGISF